MLKRRLAEVLTRTYTPRTNVKIDELIVDVLAEYKRERRKTTNDIKLRWKNHLEPFFTRLRADDLNSDHVQRYCAKREAEGACGPTINRELAVLKHAYHLALKNTPPKVRSCPMMPMYRESDPRTGFLEDRHDEADIAEAARKLDERQKSNALSFEQLERENGQSLGMIVEKSTKTEAVAHLNSTTAVLPN